MYKDQVQYNKLYRNGILYDKAFRNGQQVLGDPIADPSLLLDIPFNGDFENKVVGGIQMVAAGGSPTFANGSAVFNGSQSIKTATPLSIGTDKVTICFWVKTTQYNLSVITELSDNFNGKNAFAFILNTFIMGKVAIVDKNYYSDNYVESLSSVNGGNFVFVVATIDRDKPAAEQNRIYIDGVEDSGLTATNDFTGSWDIATLFLGQRGGVEYAFEGSMKNFKLYNRILTQQEIQDLMLL